MTTMINITDLHKTYRRGDEVVEAIRGIDLQVNDGDFVVVMGPSGGGKSTLLNLIGGIDHPSSGSIQYNGYELAGASEEDLTLFRRDHIGFVFQFYNLLFSLNAVENVLLPLMAKRVPMKAAREKAVQILTQVGLSHRLTHLPSELSGGEQQRVAIARSIIAEPKLVLADEPTGDLDSVATREINQLMHQLNQEMGITFIVATHNLLLTEKATRVVELRDGKIQ
jgi:putative ABC transport system ATP-binding protein